MITCSTDTSHGCCSSVFGRGTGPIHIEVLDCSGSEYGVAECGTSTSSCSHNEDWRVYCRIGEFYGYKVSRHYLIAFYHALIIQMGLRLKMFVYIMIIIMDMCKCFSLMNGFQLLVLTYPGLL